MHQQEFDYQIKIFEKYIGVKLASMDLNSFRNTVMMYKARHFEKAINNIIFNFNTWNGFSIKDIGELTDRYYANEIEGKKDNDIINEGPVMLCKDTFDKQVKEFQQEFELKLGSKREDLLYGAINYMTSMELQKTFIELLIIHNADDLPTVRQITSMAYTLCPAAMKENQINPFKMKLA